MRDDDKKRQQHVIHVGTRGKQVVAISSMSSKQQSNCGGNIENFDEQSGRPLTTLPTYCSPAASYRRYVSCTMLMVQPALISVATCCGEQVVPEITKLANPYLIE